jgi:hypothetical protein
MFLKWRMNIQFVKPNKIKIQDGKILKTHLDEKPAKIYIDS